MRFKIYCQLLKLYPESYREKYAQQMTQTLGDMLEDQTSRRAKELVWFRAFADLPAKIISQNALALGGNLMSQTPNYIIRNSLIASLLIMPFFAALIANGLDKAINHHDLHQSWVWSTPVLTGWILVLPALAFIICLVSYVLFVAKSTSNRSIAGRIFDLKRTWTIMLAGLIGLAIIFFLLFHDSAHCWLKGPSHTFRNFHQLSETWQCTSEGFLGGRS